VIAMTSIFVFFFGKYNDSQDLELDNKDTNQPINEPINKNVKFKVFPINLTRKKSKN
jgi:hypothetical protein